MLKKWLQVIPTNNRITKHSRICSNHFEESQYDRISGKRYLKKEAIPNRFPHAIKNVSNFKSNAFHYRKGCDINTVLLLFTERNKHRRRNFHTGMSAGYIGRYEC